MKKCICKKSFKEKMKTQKYCSTECAYKAMNDKSKERYRAKTSLKPHRLSVDYLIDQEFFIVKRKGENPALLNLGGYKWDVEIKRDIKKEVLNMDRIEPLDYFRSIFGTVKLVGTKIYKHNVR